VSETKQAKNRFGETTYFKKYILAEDKFLQENENHFS